MTLLLSTSLVISSSALADPAPNAVSLELFGRANSYSLDYDHSFSERFALGAGFSYGNMSRHRFHSSTASLTVIPVYGNYYFESGINRGFVTAGADILSASQTLNGAQTFRSSGGAAVFGGGYEYRGVSGFLFRGASYVIVGRSTEMTIGLSVGATF